MMETKDKQTIFKEENNKQQAGATGQQPTSSGLDQNLAAALCYPFGFITGLIFLLIEKENKFVKFHALQSIFTSIALFILSIILGFVPIIGWIISILSTPIIIVFIVILAFKAYKGEWVKVPVIGDMAEKQL